MASDPSIHDGLLRGSALGLRYRLALPRAALRGRNGVRLGVGAGSRSISMTTATTTPATTCGTSTGMSMPAATVR